MPYSTRMHGLGAALLMVSALSATPAAAPTVAYEARLAGATTMRLIGATAEFGSTSPGETGPFVITLGATSAEGAVVLTRWDGNRPMRGTYRITHEPSAAGIQALVVTGSRMRPTGVFRARSGTITITASGAHRVSGRFEMEAVGFLASEPDREDRSLSVRGSFTASRSAGRDR